MLDIKFIQTNQDKVRKAIADKGVDLNLDQLMDLDSKRRDLTTELESLLATKNQASKEIPKLSPEDKKVKLLEMKEVDEKTTQLKAQLQTVADEYEKLMYLVPNIPSPETPIGKDSTGNVAWRYWSPKTDIVDPTKEAEKVKDVP